MEYNVMQYSTIRYILDANFLNAPKCFMYNFLVLYAYYPVSYKTHKTLNRIPRECTLLPWLKINKYICNSTIVINTYIFCDTLYIIPTFISFTFIP